jgi:hypothetical protein
MKKTYLYLLLSSLFFCTPLCHAQDPFFWTVEVGSTSIDIEEQYYINDYDNDPEAGAISSHFGYQFDNRWLVGGGLSYATSSFSGGIIDDNYAFGELRAFTGYSFKLGEHFYLVPMIGVSRWTLITDEALIFGGDDEDPEDEMDGTDIYGQLNAEIPFNNRLSLTLSYTRVTTDPAQVSSTKLGLLGRF